MSGLSRRIVGQILWDQEAAVASKMSELQEAMNRYGETSVRNFQTIHPIGEKLIEGFEAYLGVPGCVLGVSYGRLGREKYRRLLRREI